MGDMNSSNNMNTTNNHIVINIINNRNTININTIHNMNLNIAVENVDSESRTLMDEGELHVRYEGKLIEYDQTESCTLGQDGFINFMEDIGPFVKKEGRVTFVIPDRFNATDMTYILPRSTGKVLLKQRPAESS